MRSHWGDVPDCVERQTGDVAYIETHRYRYLFNRVQSVVRRYGHDGSYCAIRVRSRPREEILANLFSSARSAGRLVVDEPAREVVR